MGVLLGLRRPSTQVSASELDLIMAHASASSTIVEIGTFEGATAAQLATTGAATYSIDPFMPGRLGVSYGQIIALRWKARLGLANLHFIRGYSFDVAGSFTLPVDFLFIDADHSYEGLQRDWSLWLPKVVTGGKIALHDVRLANTSPLRLGSMDFFESVVLRDRRVTEVASTDSLSILKKVSD